jgi:hypothetical protein
VKESCLNTKISSKVQFFPANREDCLQRAMRYDQGSGNSGYDPPYICKPGKRCNFRLTVAEPALINHGFHLT